MFKQTTAEQIIALIESGNGFTRSVSELSLGGSNLRAFDGYGYAVGGMIPTLKFTENTIARQLAAQQIARFLEVAYMLTGNNDTLIGGWLDEEEGVYHLDLVQIIPDQEVAYMVARHRKEKAVALLDYGHVTVIDLGESLADWEMELLGGYYTN